MACFVKSMAGIPAADLQVLQEAGCSACPVIAASDVVSTCGYMLLLLVRIYSKQGPGHH